LYAQEVVAGFRHLVLDRLRNIEPIISKSRVSFSGSSTGKPFHLVFKGGS
jgi:hypothetical protein